MAVASSAANDRRAETPAAPTRRPPAWRTAAPMTRMARMALEGATGAHAHRHPPTAPLRCLAREVLDHRAVSGTPAALHA